MTFSIGILKYPDFFLCADPRSGAGITSLYQKVNFNNYEQVMLLFNIGRYVAGCVLQQQGR